MPMLSPGVLLVDDDERMLRSLRRVLERGGFGVTVAPDGAAALDHLAHRPFEVVVTDVTLPRMSGLELLEELKRSRPDLPVVVYTGLPDADTSEQARRGGALIYLVEPFRPRELVDAVTVAARHGALAKTRVDAARLVPPTPAGSQTLGRTHARRARLLAALNTMSLHQQPIVTCADDALLGHELFMRTDHAPFDQPVPLLQEAAALGALSAVGRTLREEVAARLHDTDPAHLWFVNQTPQDLEDLTLLDPAAPLTRHARHVVLEFADCAALAAVPHLDQTVAELRALGYRLCLDDVGAGFSSLNAFAALAPEWIKVDLHITRGIERDPARAALVSTLCRQAHELGVLVIAEGVESASQRALLADAGCDAVQGYFIGGLAPCAPCDRRGQSGI